VSVKSEETRIGVGGKDGIVNYMTRVLRLVGVASLEIERYSKNLDNGEQPRLDISTLCRARNGSTRTRSSSIPSGAGVIYAFLREYAGSP